MYNRICKISNFSRNYIFFLNRFPIKQGSIRGKHRRLANLQEDALFVSFVALK